MTVATGNFPELLWPGINRIFGHSYDYYKPVYPSVFDVQRSSKTFEKDQGVTGLPLAAEKPQGEEITYADPVQGFAKEFVHTVYALGSSVTKEMWTDEQYNYIRRIPRFLARSMRYTEETLHSNIFNNAFSSETTADGLSIINSAHVNAATNSTQRNQPSTNSDLTQTALEQAFIDIRDWTDDQDILMMCKPVRLVVPNELMWQAEKILGTSKEPFSADNTVNPMNNKIPYVVWDYLTDPDAWYLLTDCKDGGLISYTRWATSFDRDNEFDTFNLKFLVSKRWSQGCSNWRALYASPGA